MKRREFIALVGGAATWPLAARAQQPAMPVIGYLATGSQDTFASRLAALRQGIGEHGYFEGRNVTIEYRWASGLYDQMQAFATDLVARRVDVIVYVGPPSLRRLLRRRPLFLLSS
jgi:putative ABC transport system substrate-binding protein